MKIAMRAIKHAESLIGSTAMKTSHLCDSVRLNLGIADMTKNNDNSSDLRSPV